MSSPHTFKSSKNHAKALRRQLEKDVYALTNRAALLREQEQAALIRAEQLRDRAGKAAESHAHRGFQALLWSAAREGGQHPLAGLPYTAGALDIAASADLMATLGGSGGQGQLPGGVPRDALATLVASRSAQAAAAGAELALRSPASAPPTQPIARASWVATHKSVQEEAVAAQTALTAARRAETGVVERECALERKAARAAARAARLERDRQTVERVREEEARAKAEREAHAAEVARAARLEYEAQVQAELSVLSELSAKMVPLRAMEAELADRARAATRAQAAAYDELEHSVTFPPLPLPRQQGVEDLVLAATAAAAALGEGVLIKPLGSSKGGGMGGNVGGLSTLASSRVVAGTSGAAIVATSPRVAAATASFRAAADTALGASTLGGTLHLLSHTRQSSSSSSAFPSPGGSFTTARQQFSPSQFPPPGGISTSPFGMSTSRSTHSQHSATASAAAAAAMIATARARSEGGSFSPSSPPWGQDHFGGSVPQRWGGGEGGSSRYGTSPHSSTLSPTSSRALSPSREGLPRILPVGLWPTAANPPLSPLVQTLPATSPSSSSYFARGGEMIAASPNTARVELPAEGRRSPRDSTLRASPVPLDTMRDAREAVAGAGGGKFRGGGSYDLGESGGGGGRAFGILDQSLRMSR